MIIHAPMLLLSICSHTCIRLIAFSPVRLLGHPQMPGMQPVHTLMQRDEQSHHRAMYTMIEYILTSSYIPQHSAASVTATPATLDTRTVSVHNLCRDPLHNLIDI